MAEGFVTRFAPSPTGFMHIGNLRTALYAYLLARANNGKFILRIEDTDQERLVEGAVDVIYDTLRVSGMKHDEGPDIGGPNGPYIQSQRKDIYMKYAKELVEKGYAYYCFCTKERLDSLHETGNIGAGYDRHCRNLSKEEVEKNLAEGIPFVIRQKMPLEGSTGYDDVVYGHIEIENSEMQDQILMKADGFPTYNFCHVIDDHLMGVTHVVRGCEYLTSTPKYVLLYDAFGWERPTYCHLPLIMGKNPDGTVSKLSKRHGARAVIEYEQDGLLPQALVNYLVRLGWSHGDQEIFTQEELIKFFDGTSLNPAAAAFDPAKLEWINAHFMREMPLDELAKLVRPFVEKAGLPADVADDKLAALCHMFRERAGDLKALAESFRPLLDSADELAYDEKACAKNLTDASKAHLNAVAELFAACDPFDAPSLEAALHGYIEGNGLKFKDVAPALRTALMGFMGGPHLPEIMAFLGKDASLARIRRAAGM